MSLRRFGVWIHKRSGSLLGACCVWLALCNAFLHNSPPTHHPAWRGEGSLLWDTGQTWGIRMKLMVARYQAAVGGLCSGRRRPRACPRYEGGLSCFWAGHSLSVHTPSPIASLHARGYLSFWRQLSEIRRLAAGGGGIYYTSYYWDEYSHSL